MGRMWPALLLPVLALVEGCYEELSKDLELTMAGRDARSNSTEPFVGDCKMLRGVEELWQTDEASRRLQVVFRGDAVTLLQLRNVTSEAECARAAPEDFEGPRGALVKSYEHTAPVGCGEGDEGLHVATFGHVPGGCFKILFSPRRRWLRGDAAPAVASPSVQIVGSSPSHFRVLHGFAEIFRGSTIAFYVRRALCQIPHDASDLSWFVNLSGKNDADAIICKNDTNKQVACATTSDLEVICDVKHLTQGNYCLYAVVVRDERCSYVDSCSFYTPLEVRPYDAHIADARLPPPPPPPGGPALVTTVVTVVVVVAAAGAALGLLAHFLWVSREEPPPPPPSDITAPQGKAEVLLLYALDCPALMEAAEALRVLLQKVRGTEVYDVFDRSRWDEIGRGPAAWLGALMARPGLKVLLVETPCAALQQRGAVHYRRPSAFAQLFAQGLTLALHRDYSSLYVLRFEECGDAAQQLAHLTPYRRFVLPESLESLLKDMHLSVEREELELELETLTRTTQQLLQHNTHNPHYLHNTLLHL